MDTKPTKDALPLPAACSIAVSPNWRETRSARLLYPDTIKIDAAYRKRAERYVRDAVHFYFMCDAYAASIEPKIAAKEAKVDS
jgi:hypothetical protein